MVSEGGEGGRWDVPGGSKRAQVCTGPRDMAQSGSGTGGDPSLNEVVHQWWGGDVHQLVEQSPGGMCAFQNPELTSAGGRMVVGEVWWEVRRGEGEESSLYVRWEPLTGALDRDASKVPQGDQTALL